MAIPDLATEAARRRTFAIISHPDAGKTTHLGLSAKIATTLLLAVLVCALPVTAFALPGDFGARASLRLIPGQSLDGVAEEGDVLLSQKFVPHGAARIVGAVPNFRVGFTKVKLDPDALLFKTQADVSGEVWCSASGNRTWCFIDDDHDFRFDRVGYGGMAVLGIRLRANAVTQVTVLSAPLPWRVVPEATFESNSISVRFERVVDDRGAKAVILTVRAGPDGEPVRNLETRALLEPGRGATVQILGGEIRLLDGGQGRVRYEILKQMDAGDFAFGITMGPWGGGIAPMSRLSEMNLVVQ